jgi:hypothetical protein
MRPSHQETLQRLIGMGYFKFVPNHEREAVRQQVLSCMRDGYFESYMDDKGVATDRRSYAVDNEELAEGSAGTYLLQMRDVLAQEGVLLGSVVDDVQRDHYDVLVNGERFGIYKSAFGSSWFTTPRRFLEFVNDLLQRAGSKERLFGIGGGNDGRVILLTEEMHQYVRTLPWIEYGCMPYSSTMLDAED